MRKLKIGRRCAALLRWVKVATMHTKRPFWVYLWEGVPPEGGTTLGKEAIRTSLK